MKPSDPARASCASPLPAALLLRLAGLPRLFTRPTWSNVVLLLTGAILAPGKRTVTAALRILGREQQTDFPIYHGVLNRAVWSSRCRGRLAIAPAGRKLPRCRCHRCHWHDDTIERRWGHKISARGIYRDPVRSSKGHFVKTSGLRWLSAQLLVHIPWAGRIVGLPFLTMLAPSKRFYADLSRAPKTLLDWARQAALQIHRWLPGRRIVIVGDTAFAAIEFLAAVRALCQRRHPIASRRQSSCSRTAQPAAPRTTADQGKAPGQTQPGAAGPPNRLATSYRHPLVWSHQSHRRTRHRHRRSGTHSGLPPVPIRWLLVRDPLGELQPQAFLCTDLDAAPVDILQWFVARWQLEVTFQDARAHLGVETQRQWSDLAIPRTTPALLGLCSLVTLWAHHLAAETPLAPATAAWYSKATLHLQRCHRRCTPTDLASSEFLHVAAASGCHQNSPPTMGTRRKRTRLCRVIR